MHRTSGHAGVPRENIIDLRAARAAELQHINTPPPSGWQRFSNAFSQWRSRPRRSSVESISRKNQERVIISERSRPTEMRAATPPPVEKERVSTPPSSPPRQKQSWSWEFTPGWSRRVAGFALVCLVLILPVVGSAVYQDVVQAKGTVLGISQNAYDSLRAAGMSAQSADFTSAADRFNHAAEQFSAAQKELSQSGGALVDAASLLPGAAQSADSLLTAGNYFSTAGARITTLLGGVQDISVNPTEHSSSGSSLTVYLALIRDGLEPIITDIQRGSEELARVRIKDLPDEYRDSIAELQETLPELSTKLQSFASLSDTLLGVLGHDGPRRYLMVFQNNRELRPTGGFIGSLALVDMYQGAIEEIEVPGGGVYDLAGQLDKKIISPKPLWLVNPHWNIQDSNWFPDFPTSAEKMLWFLERAGGTSADGVLSLTPTVIERLLEITGPIEMADYGVTITSDNFVRQAQIWAEVTYDRQENQPKKLIGDLLPMLLNKVFASDPENLVSVVHALTASLQDRSMLLYFTDTLAQEEITNFGWDGRLHQTTGDYVYVVNTNIGGGKTDHVVDQLINHTATIQSDGSIMNTVSITRAHRGSSRDRWEGQANVSYVRLYVPHGSQLLSVEGHDTIVNSRFQLPDLDASADEDLSMVEQQPIIDEKTDTRISHEFGRTVFGSWISIDPGEVQTMTFTYRLPFAMDMGGFFGGADTYQLYVQQQPGVTTSSFVSTVLYPKNLTPRWISPGVSDTGQAFTYAADLTGDAYFAALLEK